MDFSISLRWILIVNSNLRKCICRSDTLSKLLTNQLPSSHSVSADACAADGSMSAVSLDNFVFNLLHSQSFRVRLLFGVLLPYISSNCHLMMFSMEVPERRHDHCLHKQRYSNRRPRSQGVGEKPLWYLS